MLNDYDFNSDSLLLMSGDGKNGKGRKFKITFFDYQFSLNGSDYSADGAVEWIGDEIIVSVYLLATDSFDMWVEVLDNNELNYVGEFLGRDGQFHEYAEALYNLNA